MRQQLIPDPAIADGRFHVHAPDVGLVRELAQLFALKTDNPNEVLLLECTEHGSIFLLGEAFSDDSNRRVAFFLVARCEGGGTLLQTTQAERLERRSVAGSQDSNLHKRPNV